MGVHMKRVLIFLLLITITICLSQQGYAQGQNEVRLLTYYPAPYGVYQRLEVRDSGPNPIDLFTIYQDTNTAYGWSGAMRFVWRDNVPQNWVTARIKSGCPSEERFVLTFELLENVSDQNTTAEYMRLTNQGRLGLGIPNPEAILDMRQSINPGSGHEATGMICEPMLTASGNDQRLIGAHIRPIFAPETFTNIQEIGLIVEGGRVGLGTVDPNCKLQVQDVGEPPNFRLAEFTQSETDGADASIKIRGSRSNSTDANVAFIDLNDFDSDESGGTEFTMARISAGMEDTSGQGGYLRFFTNRNADNLRERMRIDSEGRVGIGTTSPNSPLHILMGDTTDTYNLPMLTLTRTGILGTTIENNEGYKIDLKLENSNGDIKTFAEIVLIGTNVTAGSEEAELRIRVTPFANSNTICIKSNGKIGMGTNNPQGGLDVTSSAGGLIVPRMSLTEIKNLTNPPDGSIVFCLTTPNRRFYFREGTQWVDKDHNPLP